MVLAREAFSYSVKRLSGQAWSGSISSFDGDRPDLARQTRLDDGDRQKEKRYMGIAPIGPNHITRNESN